ncbi:MAG: BTAD domain-containing putative transcriptional regulator, partial [Micromonosporaceae bacterium]
MTITGVAGDLRIFVLGGFRAEVGGQSVAEEAWRRSGAVALVKLLAVTPGHRMHREQLIEVLWPGLDQAAGGRRLTKALHFARRALAAGQLRLRDDLLSLDADDLWIDVDAFEAAARQGDTDQALALYTGDLLPENRFEEWAQQRREQLRETVVRLLRDHGTELEVRGDYRAAATAFERLVGIDPVDEEAYARLMHLASLDGQRHVAVRWYGRLVESLREELGVAPTDDLQRLYADVVAGRLPAARGVHPPDGALLARPRPATHPEERKLVTVLAADLPGARGEPGEPDPERARRATATWTDTLCEVTGRWGGAVERLAGGGVVAVFGYPMAREDHAARALWAGFEILRRVPAPIRLGIDTGEVIAPADGAAPLSRLGGDVLN